MKFSSFVVKIVSPCNLNCTYCYEYNALDDSWKSMPKVMSIDTAKQVALSIKEHLLPNSPTSIPIVFHGGEPLMAKVGHFSSLIKTFREVLEPEITPLFGLQTNGLLMSDAFIKLFNEEDISVGVSCDGPPKINDRFRVNHSGKGSGKKLETVLKKLQGEPCFKNILCVLDASSDPLDVYEYLIQFNPRVIDFLLPHGTYDNPPWSKDSFESTDYADWLIKIFDQWFFHSDGKIKIRMFEEIIENTLGGMGALESLGLNPVTLLIVASDGSFEGVDTLKVVAPNAHVLEMNAYQHTLDNVSKHPKVTMRQLGEAGLCETCSNCDLRRSCGGGYLPHRYAKSNGFSNPSIYCRDLYKLISHIEKSVRQLVMAKKQGA